MGGDWCSLNGTNIPDWGKSANSFSAARVVNGRGLKKIPGIENSSVQAISDHLAFFWVKVSEVGVLGCDSLKIKMGQPTDLWGQQ